MGVYIKGMDMPKRCGECHFCHSVCFETWCCITERDDVLFDAIPEWCPLTEVPEPHGRLIDIEDTALLKTVSCGGLSTKKLWKRIKEQPIVIERSE